jgi:hypothetical protein
MVTSLREGMVWLGLGNTSLLIESLVHSCYNYSDDSDVLLFDKTMIEWYCSAGKYGVLSSIAAATTEYGWDDDKQLLVREYGEQVGTYIVVLVP